MLLLPTICKQTIVTCELEIMWYWNCFLKFDTLMLRLFLHCTLRTRLIDLFFFGALIFLNIWEYVHFDWTKTFLSCRFIPDKFILNYCLEFCYSQNMSINKWGQSLKGSFLRQSIVVFCQFIVCKHVAHILHGNIYLPHFLTWQGATRFLLTTRKWFNKVYFNNM